MYRFPGERERPGRERRWILFVVLFLVFFTVGVYVINHAH